MDMTSDENEGVPPQTAMAIIPGGGIASEFPVLKAFQQYIDAEQAKAQKRMVGLAVFFIVLLVVVVVTFVLVLMPILSRNQSLQDRLLDVVFQQKMAAAQQPQAMPPQVVNVQPVAGAQQSGLETQFAEMQLRQAAEIEKLRRELADKDREREEELRAAREKEAVERAAALEAQLKASAQRMAELEKAVQESRAKDEAATRREADLEAYRRRHYAYYYDTEAEAPQAAAPQAPARAVQAPVVPEEPAPRPAAALQPQVVTPQAVRPQPQPQAAPAAFEEDEDLDLPAIDYYSQYDDGSQVSSAGSVDTLNVRSGDMTIPFLIDLPQQK